MQCSNCHQEFSQPSRVCPYCGERQESSLDGGAAPSKPALSQTFAQAVNLLLTNLSTLAPIILTITLPVHLIRSYLLTHTDLMRSSGVALLLQYASELPFHALIEPAFYMALFAIPTGRRLTVIDAYRESLHWWPRMFGVYLKLWVLTMLGFMLFIVPAIWIMVIFAFTDLTALFDPDRKKNPFTASSQLVSGNHMTILAVVLLQLISSFLFERLLHLDRGVLQMWWVNALFASAFAVAVRLFSTILLLLYVRTRLARGEIVPTFDDLFPRLAQRYAIVPEA